MIFNLNISVGLKGKKKYIDPDRENKRALKAYQKAGFENFSVEKSSEYNETIQFEDWKNKNE